MRPLRGRDGMPAMATVTPNHDDIQEWSGDVESCRRSHGPALCVCVNSGLSHSLLPPRDETFFSEQDCPEIRQH